MEQKKREVASLLSLHAFFQSDRVLARYSSEGSMQYLPMAAFLAIRWIS